MDESEKKVKMIRNTKEMSTVQLKSRRKNERDVETKLEKWKTLSNRPATHWKTYHKAHFCTRRDNWISKNAFNDEFPRKGFTENFRTSTRECRKNYPERKLFEEENPIKTWWNRNILEHNTQENGLIK